MECLLELGQNVRVWFLLPMSPKIATKKHAHKSNQMVWQFEHQQRGTPKVIWIVCVLNKMVRYELVMNCHGACWHNLVLLLTTTHPALLANASIQIGQQANWIVPNIHTDRHKLGTESGPDDNDKGLNICFQYNTIFKLIFSTRRTEPAKGNKFNWNICQGSEWDAIRSFANLSLQSVRFLCWQGQQRYQIADTSWWMVDSMTPTRTKWIHSRIWWPTGVVKWQEEWIRYESLGHNEPAPTTTTANSPSSPGLPSPSQTMDRIVWVRVNPLGKQATCKNETILEQSL